MGPTASPLPTIDSVEIRDVLLPLRRPHQSGTGTIGERHLLIVAVRSGDVVGWGECGPVPGYSMETIDACRRALRSLAAGLLRAGPHETHAPAAARFAIDSALTDIRGKMEGTPCWRMIGGASPEVPVGAVIGLGTEGNDLARAAAGLAETGYRRIKLKVAPGRTAERTARLRRTLPSHDLAVDANGTFPPGEDAELGAIDDLGLSFIEQPHSRRSTGATTDLASRLATPVCLDESITDLRTAATAISQGLPWVLNVKPARVGGLSVAALITAMATGAGIPVWCGGMLESGIGKAAALAVATLRGMGMPADLAPSARHFDVDLVDPPWSMTGGVIRVPDRPGLGVEVDAEALDHFATATERIGEGF